MPAEIQMPLFNLLDEVAKIADANKNQEDPDQRILNIHKIQGNLDYFVENFFVQFFEAFDLNLEYISEESLSEVENHFSGSKNGVPKNVIEVFKQVTEVIEDMEDAVYFDPPEEDKVYYAYLTFLPTLFESFKKDEVVVQVNVSNYGPVKVRMEGILVRIGAIKHQLLA